MTSPRPANAAPASGGAIAGSLTGPAKPQPAAPLTDEQLRLQCVTLAIQAKTDPRYVTESAERLRAYIKDGTSGQGPKMGMAG